MKQRRNTILKFLKFMGYFLYGTVMVTLIISGLEVQRILQNYGYVQTTYAQTIEVEDYTYFYREVGEENEETILMIHGFLGSSYDFIEVMEALKDRYHILAVDMIGFGLSEKSLEFDYGKANQAQYLVKFLNALNIPEVLIIAHSMGGEVSIHLAHDYPLLVKGMILVGSGGYVEESSNALMPSDLPLFVYDYVVQNYLIQRTFFYTAYAEVERKNKLVTQKDFDEMYLVNRTIPGSVLREFTRDNDSGTTNPKLANIEQPTLLIWGEFDGFIPLSTGEKLLTALGDNAKMVVMADAGHLPFDTYFDAFMEHVEEFLL